MDLMNDFIRDRKYLEKLKVKMKIIYGQGSPCLAFDNPILLSSFLGYVKKRKNQSDIYIRGESNDYEHLIPSLFRDNGAPLSDNDLIKRRFQAYNELKKMVHEHFGGNFFRFEKESIDNILQHYRIKSPVIDLVDNIYTGIWFATYKNKGKYGYLRLIDANSKDLSVSDLRKQHSSLSLRMHTQHGLIIKKKVMSWNNSNILYDEFEVARVRFKLDTDIQSGILFSEKNFFPEKKYDHTLHVFKKNLWFKSSLEILEKKYGLSNGDLGKID